MTKPRQTNVEVVVLVPAGWSPAGWLERQQHRARVIDPTLGAPARTALEAAVRNLRLLRFASEHPQPGDRDIKAAVARGENAAGRSAGT